MYFLCLIIRDVHEEFSNLFGNYSFMSERIRTLLQYLLSARDPALWADNRAKFDADTAKVKAISTMYSSLGCVGAW
jgi:hypothetical protein